MPSGNYTRHILLGTSIKWMLLLKFQETEKRRLSHSVMSYGPVATQLEVCHLEASSWSKQKWSAPSFSATCTLVQNSTEKPLHSSNATKLKDYCACTPPVHVLKEYCSGTCGSFRLLSLRYTTAPMSGQSQICSMQRD